jgi:broad specificity polyphosphatase/5'/3'-nucleotidase SurE
MPTAPERALGKGRPGYEVNAKWKEAEADSDMRALGERVISVTPLSLDLTSRVSLPAEASLLPDPGLQLSLPQPILILEA